MKERPLYAFLKLLSVVCVWTGYSSCRHLNEEPFNPCEVAQKLEDLWPTTLSVDYLNYPVNRLLLFTNSQGETDSFRVAESMQAQEGLYSSFKIQCPYDSAQQSQVDYHVKEYSYTLVNLDTNSLIQNIQFELSVVLDERSSTLDRPLLADLLTIRTKQSRRGSYKVLQFPLTLRGYENPIQGGYQFYEIYNLAGRQFSNVYVNEDNESELKLYCNQDGLIGIQSSAGLFLIK